MDMRWNHVSPNKLCSSDKLQQDFVFHFQKASKRKKETKKWRNQETKKPPSFWLFFRFFSGWEWSQWYAKNEKDQARDAVRGGATARGARLTSQILGWAGSRSSRSHTLSVNSAVLQWCHHCTINIESIPWYQFYSLHADQGLALILLALNLQFVIFI